jgi:hypothetical protein
MDKHTMKDFKNNVAGDWIKKNVHVPIAPKEALHIAELISVGIDAGYSEAIKQRWIPVSERFPEKGIEVLIWSERYGRTFATFIDQNKYGTIWQYHGDTGVTFNAPSHWQSLPPKPSFTEQEQSTKEDNG